MCLVWDDMYIGQGCPEESLEFHVFVPYKLLSCEAAIKSENRIDSVMACCFIIITNNSTQLCMVKAVQIRSY